MRLAGTCSVANHRLTRCCGRHGRPVTEGLCRRFVRNVGAICAYAFAGTFISTVAIGITM